MEGPQIPRHILDESDFSISSISTRLKLIVSKGDVVQCNQFQLGSQLNPVPYPVPFADPPYKQPDQPYPTNRRPYIRPLASEPQDVVNECLKTCKVDIGPLATGDLRKRVSRLLYTYRDLNAIDLKDILPTDLYIHRIRLKPGIEPYRIKKRIRYSPQQQWWLNKIITEGQACGMYEYTHSANGKLSDWSAQPLVVPKPGVEYPTNLPKDDPGPERRIVFDYSNVKEVMPGNYCALASDVHEYLSHPSHMVFHQLDLKHAYWGMPLHPDDRHIFAFSVGDSTTTYPGPARYEYCLFFHV